ncbi:MAG TPA: hypothetical protein VIU63_08095, partial [Nitrospira sp.]
AMGIAIASSVLAGNLYAGTESTGAGAQGMKSEPAGIGEKGTGQTQNTMDRQQSSMNSHGLASEPAGIGEKGTGQTESTTERSGGGQTRSQGMKSEPAGIGEKGTGQTQSAMDR